MVDGIIEILEHSYVKNVLVTIATDWQMIQPSQMKYESLKS